MKTINLRSDKVNTHYFDSNFEVNPSDKQVSAFFDVNLDDNYTYDTNEVRYQLKTPVTPIRTIQYNMATKKSKFINQEHIANMPPHLTCEKIQAKSRDGSEIPMVMVYDKRFYSDSSPWIMKTRGSLSNKDDLGFKANWLSLTDRGVVIAFPMLRGTKFFDDNWFFSGVAERKHVHIEDLIDSAIFIKENCLTEKIGLFSTGYSGSHAALTAVLYEPYLFHGATFLNPITDLPNHLQHDIQTRDKLKQDKQKDIWFSSTTEFGNIMTLPDLKPLL